MASSSTSSIQKIFKYDVFLSFRGDDTRKNFVDHLYEALKHKSIQTYKDDEEINKGNKISDELINSIQDSKFYIIVFSKNYASSSWCLDELVKIMECQTRKDQTAYPVFYDVEPTEVRNQIGAVGEAFAKHENAEAAGKWRGALKEAADLAGWELKANFNGHEAKFIKKIVEEISLEIRPIWSGTYGNLVGMETRVEKVVSSLQDGKDDVRMIGIKGIGGGGKTTLARAVFDKISARFEGQSFVENVREVSKASLYGLKSLQKQVLSDVSNDQGITVNSVSDGKNMMKRMMISRRVLVVLDDVDHIDQLEALAGEPNWFKSGSRIIISTRDEQVLVAHRVNLTLDVNLLSDEEAICLFSRYAFGREVPIEGYEELSTRVVRYAAGLPLTMRVLGSYLCGKDNLEWVDALERLQTIPLEETLQKLEISYIGLENDYREIFLDVACFLKGRNKDEAIEVLESQGFYARNGLRVLQQKSLITTDQYNFLNMHDHIEEMGKNIVRRLHPHEPWRHSRLWIEAEIKDILANDKGTTATRGIQLRTLEFGPETYMRGLRKMKKLIFLDVTCINDDDDGDRSSWKFDKCGHYLPNSLRYLEGNSLPLEYLPITFLANNLVALVMRNSNIVRLWEEGERKALNKLRFLDLSSSKLITLDFELTPNLETLYLSDCDNMVEFHNPNGFPKLKSLNLYDNKNLRNLTLESTPDLESLCLDGCCDLVELLMPDECPNLKYLILDNNSTLRNLTLGSTPDLESLSLDGCCDLVELHMPYKYPKLKSIIIRNSKLKTLEPRLISNLEKLNLEGCDLVELHMPNECPNLKYLILDNNSTLKNLTLGSTPDLESLSLDECYDLVEFHMPCKYPKLKSIIIRSSKLKTLELGLISDLETLSLEGCDSVELHMPDECANLKYLILDNNSMLRNLTLGSTPNLELLSLDGCCDLVELHMPYKYPKLKSIIIRSSKLKTLEPRLISNLEKLILEGCDLVELHMPDECPNLKYLLLDNNSTLRNLTLGSTPDLESLSLDGCCDLVELHMPYKYPKLKSIIIRSSKLKTLEPRLISNLRELSLKGCGLVELHIPDECPNLKYLDLIDNSTLRNLTLGSTPDLEWLILIGCCDLVELHMPYRYPKLKSISIRSSKLKTLELGRISDLETLILNGCGLVELHMPDECPNLNHLDLSDNSTLRNLTLGSTPDLKWLSLEGCCDFVELHMPDEFPNLRNLTLGERKALNKLRFLHLSSSNMITLVFELTQNLETLYLSDCDNMGEFHNPNGFPKLKSLNLYDNKNLRNLTLGPTPHLESLWLERCCDLLELHMPEKYPKLKSIYIRSSKLKTLEPRMISNLETLSLDGCDLVELHMPDECPNLTYLILDNNSMLRNLTLGSTPDLESLSLDGCCDLVELHMPYKYPKLKSIIIRSSKLKTLEPRLISNLEKLSLEGCDLVELHMPDECPNLKYLILDNNSTLRNLTLGSTPDLEVLSLEGCCDLVELHMPDECPNLKYLDLNHNSKLRNLTLGSTPYLESLSIYGCCDLVELHMPYRYPKLKFVIIGSSKLKTLELGLISYLETLILKGCDLVELHMPDECPNLKDLILDNNSTLRNLTLRSTPDLEYLSLNGCCDLIELHMPYRYPKLKSIIIRSSKLKTLELGLISDLETLSLEGCDLVELHMPDECPNLNYLNLNYNSTLRNLTLGSTPDLESLSLDGCCDLVELHMPYRYPKLKSIIIRSSKLKTLELGLISYLETLSLNGCGLVELHMPDESPNLKYLHLSGNSTLRNLTLGSTPDLKWLSLKGCSDLVEVHMPDEFPNLKKINVNNNSTLRNVTLGERKALNKLRFLDLSSSKLITLVFELTPNLKGLNLSYCDDMVEFHNPNGFPKLKFLNLGHNKYLRNLNLGSTPDLESLCLDGCSDLVELHVPYKYPKLKSVIIRSSKLKTLEPRLISNLEKLYLERCDLVELHMPDECPNLKYLILDNNSTLRNLTLGSTPNLELLGLDGCCDLVELHMPYKYPKLKSIIIRSSKLKTLEPRLISNLEKLSLEGCDLVELHMPDECPNLKYVILDNNSTLRNLTLGSTHDLELLSIYGCCDLVELHMPYKYPKLKFIIIRSSKLKTLELGLISYLETLILKGCDLVELHMPDECPNLKDLILDNNSTLRNLTLGSTPDLEYLSLNGCCDLVELHMPYRYPKLKSIIIRSSKLKTLEFGLISDLETLSLEGCDLVELHMPDECPNLKYLNLNYNSTLRNLILGSTPDLESLSLDGCCDLVELHMPYRYPKLKSIILTCL